ncbi:hypothetical protein GHT09_016927 [Marmota monax]|uniref:2Fe-2S ferredoxin-type domain-containing protein n=1 Tax=Marmota monax TaxID=9995 RepID=A0A834PK17_MARMO|nr:hypothetical protein GHT09_016927 [Marmota monax]
MIRDRSLSVGRQGARAPVLRAELVRPPFSPVLLCAKGRCGRCKLQLFPKEATGLSVTPSHPFSAPSAGPASRLQVAASRTAPLAAVRGPCGVAQMLRVRDPGVIACIAHRMGSI